MRAAHWSSYPKSPTPMLSLVSISWTLPCRTAQRPRTTRSGYWTTNEREAALGRDGIVERIARRAHRANRIAHAIDIKRLAQAPDMDVDGARFDIDVTAPHGVEQLLAREHAA